MIKCFCNRVKSLKFCTRVDNTFLVSYFSVSVMPKNKKNLSDSDSDTSVEDRSPPKPAPKKQKQSSSSSSKKPSSGDEEPSWLLEKNRFVKVREFRGKVMVDIREYYEKDGELLPGKKGISLTAIQWKKFKGLVDEIDEKVSEF